MEVASRPAIPEPPIAVIGQLSENSRLGFGPAESTLFQGAMQVKYLNGVRDTTSVASNPWQMSLKVQQTTTTTQSPVSVTQVGDHQVLFQQTTSVTTTTRDANGNVTGQTTTATLTSAMYSLASGTPTFQYGNQTVNPGLFAVPSSISQSQAESSLGGASNVYDAMASIIRNDGRIRFGAATASALIWGGEMDLAIQAKSAVEAVGATIRLVLEHWVSEQH